jgi:hypothetical protein
MVILATGEQSAANAMLNEAIVNSPHNPAEAPL